MVGCQTAEAAHPHFLPEFEALSQTVQNEVAALIKVLSVFGPQLRRPHADIERIEVLQHEGAALRG